MDADQIIKLLELQPLPGEGGQYVETYRSGHVIPAIVLPECYRGGGRSLGTAIYYLLTSDTDSFSAIHRLRSDEIYHFYLGDAVELLLLQAEGASRTIRLGQDLAIGERVQFVVPAYSWQGLRLMPGGTYALLGTTMAPGFDREDFELGIRSELITRYSTEADRIRALTRA